MMGAAAPILPAGDKPRVEPRVRAMVRACFRDSDSLRECCVIDVSTRGLLVSTARPPGRGEFVEFQIGRHQIVGHVKWSGGRRFGVALQERVSPTAIVEGGTGQIALARSVGQAKRRNSLWRSLQDNPHMLGRAATLGMFVLAMLVAGYLIYEVTLAGLDPMRHAVMAMNSK